MFRFQAATCTVDMLSQSLADKTIDGGKICGLYLHIAFLTHCGFVFDILIKIIYSNSHIISKELERDWGSINFKEGWYFNGGVKNVQEVHDDN